MAESCRPVQELGCGNFGCVLETTESGSVIKVTSDKTEAFFAACYMQLRDKLTASLGGVDKSGIVDYKGIVEIPGRRLSGAAEVRSRRGKAGALFVLWREAASYVGNWMKGAVETDPGDKDFEDLVYGTARELDLIATRISYAAAGCAAIIAKLDNSAVRYRLIEDELRKRYEFEDVFLPENLLGQRLYPPNGLKGPFQGRLRFYLRYYESLVRLLQDYELGVPLGRTLEFLFTEGLMLADLHQGNFGVRPGGYFPIVTDPGFATAFKRKWEMVEFPVLEEV